MILGRKCKVGSDSILLNSTVGDNCSIGNNVCIKDSILLDGVRVENGCQIQGSIIARNVIIQENVIVNSKSVLGDGVQVARDSKINEETRLVASKASDGFSDDEEEGRLYYFSNE